MTTPFISEIEKIKGNDDLITKAQYLLAKVKTNKRKMTFITSTDLLAVPVNQEQIKIGKPFSPLPDTNHLKFSKGSKLLFVPHEFPWSVSDTELITNHVADMNGQAYLLCSKSVFGLSIRPTRIHLLNDQVTLITEKEHQKSARLPINQKRLNVAHKWFAEKKIELSLNSDASEQTVHETLCEIKKQRLTQKYYWLEWHEIDSKLFKINYDFRNFFKTFRGINFSDN